MNTELVKTDIDPKIVESLIIHGDLSRLTPLQKTQHYLRVCESVGLNPATQPFAYFKMEGKEVLYALKGCAEQLRQIHGVTIEIVSKEHIEDLFVVTARAKKADGRIDEDVGAVRIEGLQGKDLANAMMKAMTKAKRRVTLSICGLGMLDESEIADLSRPIDIIPKEEMVINPKSEDSKIKIELIGEGSVMANDKLDSTIVRSVPPLRHLENRHLDEMKDEELEAIVEHLSRALDQWSNDPRFSQQAKIRTQGFVDVAKLILSHPVISAPT